MDKYDILSFPIGSRRSNYDSKAKLFDFSFGGKSKRKSNRKRSSVINIEPEPGTNNRNLSTDSHSPNDAWPALRSRTSLSKTASDKATNYPAVPYPSIIVTRSSLKSQVAQLEVNEHDASSQPRKPPIVKIKKSRQAKHKSFNDSEHHNTASTSRVSARRNKRRAQSESPSDDEVEPELLRIDSSKNPKPSFGKKVKNKSQLSTRQPSPKKVGGKTSSNVIELDQSESESSETDHNDPSDLSSDEDIEAIFLIDENQDMYSQLRNADLTKNILLTPVSKTKNVAGYMEPTFSDDRCEEEYPGVMRTITSELNPHVGTGYMTIEGRTIRPPESSDSLKLVFWIIKGQLKVKSGGGFYRVPDTPGTKYCLFGKELGPGSCIIVPKDTMYTFENWKAEDVLLSYAVLQDEKEDSEML